MFAKYNAVLRGVRSQCSRQFARWYAGCKGNRYTTTIWVLNSAITKLSQLNVADRVYRGVRGGMLPQLWRLGRASLDASLALTLTFILALTHT